MSFVVGEVTAYIVGDDSEFTKTINKVRQEGDQAANSITSQFEQTSKTFGTVGKNLTKWVTAPLMGVGTAVSWTGMQFEQAMSEVQAISGATGTELAALEEQAKELGATTRFSASEAAAGMKFLGMAGFETNQIMSAMPGLLDLAAAANMDLAAAADITSNVLSGFAMEAEEASRVADVLAKTASSANTDVYMMGEAMKFVAPVAAGLGISLEETSAAIGILGDAGIQASMAGTTLRSGLLRLASPTSNVKKAMKELGVEFFDSEGKMKSLTEIISQLEVALSDMTEQQKTATLEMLFGKNAVSGWMALIEAGGDKLGKFTHDLENASGAASDMAKIMTDNTAGSLIELKSAAEGLMLAFYESLGPSIRFVTDWLTNLTRTLTEMDAGTRNMIVSIGVAATALGPLAFGASKVLGVVGPLVGTLGTASKAMTGVGAAAGAAKVGFLGLSGPVGWVTAGLVGAGAAAVGLAHHLSQDALPEVEIFGEGVSDATKQALQGFIELHEGAMRELTELRWSGEAITEEMGESIVSKITQMNEQVLEGMEKEREEMVALTIRMMGEMNDVTEEELNETINLINEHYEERKALHEEKEQEILEIIRSAMEEQREFTTEEWNKINEFLDESLQIGIETLSEYRSDAIAIHEALRQQEGVISAERARQIVADRIREKEEAIAAIEEEYHETVKWATYMRDEVGAISAEQADEIIAQATRQKEGAVAEIEQMTRDIIGQAQLAALEHLGAVDWQTGESLSKWQQLRRNLNGEYDEMLVNFIAWLEEQNIVLDKNQLEMIGLSERRYNEMRTKIQEALTRIEEDNLATAENLYDIYKSIQLREVGEAMMDGLAAGMEAKRPYLISKARGIAADMNAAYRSELQIRSPSRVMMRSGFETVEGIRLGMEKGAQSIFSTISNITRDIMDRFNISPALSGLPTPQLGPMPSVAAINQTDIFGKIRIEVPVIIDGREVARVSGPHLEQELERLRRMFERARGER